MQSLDDIAAGGAPAFAQRQRLLALCGWETRVMPFAVGEKQGTAPPVAVAATPERSEQGRGESRAVTQQEAQVATGSAMCLRLLTRHFATACMWDAVCCACSQGQCKV